eukprot:6211090-Pleurochrysis_carterae.AAC.1
MSTLARALARAPARTLARALKIQRLTPTRALNDNGKSPYSAYAAPRLVGTYKTTLATMYWTGAYHVTSNINAPTARASSSTVSGVPAAAPHARVTAERMRTCAPTPSA